MIPEKLHQLITLLTEKTKEKKALWNKGSGGDSQFILSLSQGAAISVTEWIDNWGNSAYNVTIFNSNGDAIEKFAIDQNSAPEDIDVLYKFHKAASNQFYKVDETMDALLTSVMSQDVIGVTLNIPENDKIDDDDLPF